jgi:hypothetical protein
MKTFDIIFIKSNKKGAKFAIKISQEVQDN